jgi:hypothetical protein
MGLRQVLFVLFGFPRGSQRIQDKMAARDRVRGGPGMTDEERFALKFLLDSVGADYPNCEASLRPLCVIPPTGSAPEMTNGDFHCPACGEVKKGPLFCGNCLWQAPEAIDAEIAASPAASVLTDRQIIDAFEPYREFPVNWIADFGRDVIALLAASKNGG